MFQKNCDGCGVEFRMHDQTMFVSYGLGPEYELCLYCSVEIMAHLARLGLLTQEQEKKSQPLKPAPKP